MAKWLNLLASSGQEVCYITKCNVFADTLPSCFFGPAGNKWLRNNCEAATPFLLQRADNLVLLKP